MSRPDPSFLLSAGVDQAVQRVLAVAFGNNYVVSSSTIGIFLYVAQPVERVLATAFGNKLCCFESKHKGMTHIRNVTLYCSERHSFPNHPCLPLLYAVQVVEIHRRFRVTCCIHFQGTDTFRQIVNPPSFLFYGRLAAPPPTPKY